MKHRPRAFTLLEVAIVTTLMAIAVGVAALNMQGLTDEARLQSTIDQVGGRIRLAAFRAAVTGRAVRVRGDGRGCLWEQLVKSDGVWRWTPGPRMEWDSSVTVIRAGAARDAAGDRTVDGHGGDGRGWEFVIRPGERHVDLQLDLRTSRGTSARARVNPWLGVMEP